MIPIVAYDSHSHKLRDRVWGIYGRKFGQMSGKMIKIRANLSQNTVKAWSNEDES
jgi:hypothetical protein